MLLKKADRKELRKELIEYFGKDWWMEVLEWLKENVNYPKTQDIPEDMKVDFHPVFRNLVRSIFRISNREAAGNRLVAYSRMDLLKNMRPSLLPHYLGILCPVFRSRSIGHFGLVSMKVEKGDIFSRAFYNLPFPFDQKVKRTVISCYGIAKHGRRAEDLEHYPNGGVFLLNPDKDEKYEKFAKYTDYSYVTLNWRFPKNYDEFIKTLDGSVLVSKSAARKLRYKRIGYAIITNPAKEISEKLLGIVSKKIPKKGVKVEYQQELTDYESELARLSSVVGYITDVKLLTPQVKEPERRVWWIKIEEDRDAEIGCKVESPQGIKHVIAGYTDDEEPTIVINPDTFKDRAIWTEVKKTGKIHCYPTIPGMDGNISTRNIRISRTLVQGIFCYPPKVRDQIIEAIFNKKNLVFPFPENILKILENMPRIDPEKLVKRYPVFWNYLYYTRRKKVGDQVYYYVEPTRLFRAWKRLNQLKDYKKLSLYEKRVINEFIRNIVRNILLFDSKKKCKIKIRGFIRIILFHSDPDVDKIIIGRKLWKDLGTPEYVLFAKEPITRDTSIRCLRVEVRDKVPPWVVYVHPYLAMDHEDPSPEKFFTKMDSFHKDTPIMVRDSRRNIHIIKISDLLPEPEGEEDRRIVDGLEIFTARGWYPIKYVIAHKTDKKKILLRTTKGFACVTDNHEFIIRDNLIEAKNLREGDELEIVEPELPEQNTIPEDLAYVYGVFMGDGNALVYKKNGKNGRYPAGHVRISNTDRDILERCVEILKKYGYPAKIYRQKITRNGKDELYIEITQSYAESKKWREMFYTHDGEKKIPPEILMGNRKIKRAFIRGLIDSDGHRYENGIIDISTTSQVAVWGIQLILKSLGYKVSISPDKRKSGNCYGKKWLWKVRTVLTDRRKDPSRIAEIIYDEFDKDEYVYDVAVDSGEIVTWNIRARRSDGDLAIIIPLEKPIEGAMHKVRRKYTKLWNEAKNVTIDTVKHFNRYKNLKDFLVDVYEYNRRESLELLIMQTFGGIKNRAMFTDLIKDWKKWREFVMYWDLELKGFQAEKFNPELRDAPLSKLNEFYTQMLKEGLTAKLPDYVEEYKELRNLEQITFPQVREIRKTLEKLENSDHPVIKLMGRIYRILGII